MKTLKESILADIESTIKDGDDIDLCNRLLSNNKKQRNDAIIDLMDKIENIKTNKIDLLESTAINKLKRSAQNHDNYIVKIFVIDGKYNVSICKFMYAGIWTILNIFSNDITMYARANWEDVSQQLIVVPSTTIIYELVSDELNGLLNTLCNNAKDYIVDL